LGAVFESSTATIADGSTALQGAISGAEDALLGDATADAIAGASGDAVAGIGEVVDSIAVAAGDAGVGVLSILPSWLVSGGLAALASELAFAVFAVFVLLTASGNAASEAVKANRGDSLMSKKQDIPEEEMDIASKETLDTTAIEESVEEELMVSSGENTASLITSLEEKDVNS